MKIDAINELITRESAYSITHPLYIPDSKPNPVTFLCYPEYSNPELSTLEFAKRFPWWEVFLAVLLSSSSCIEIAGTKQSNHKSHNANIQTSGISNAVKQFSIHINNLKGNDVKEFYQVLEEKYATYFRKHTPNDYYLSMINLQNFNNKKVYQPKLFTPRPFELMYTLTLAHCSYNLLDYIKKVLSEGLGIDILLNNQPVPFEIPKFTSNLDHKANSSTSKNKSLSSNSQPVFILTTTTIPLKFQSPEQHTAYLVFQEVLHWCYASDDFSLDALIHYLPSGLSKINNMQNYIANMCQVYHKYWLGPDIDRIFSEKYPEIFSSRLQKIIDIQSTDSESQTQISNTIMPNTTVQKTDINSKLNKEQQYYKDFSFLLTSNVLTYWLLLSGTAYQTPYHVTHTQEGKTGSPLKIIEILSSIPFEHFSMLFYQMHDIAYSRHDIDKSFASKVTFHAFRAPYMFTIKNREKDISVLTGNFYAGNGHYLPEHQILDIEHFYNGKDLVGYYCPFINGSAVITEDLFHYFKAVLNREILQKFKDILSKDFLHYRILFDFLGDVTKPSQDIASIGSNTSTVPLVQNPSVKTKSLDHSVLDVNSNRTTLASSKSSEIPLTTTGEVDFEKYLLDTTFNPKNQKIFSTDTDIEENIPKTFKDIKSYSTNSLVCKACFLNNNKDCHSFPSQYDLLKHIFFQHLPVEFLFELRDFLNTSTNLSLDLLRYELLEFFTSTDTKTDDIGSLKIGLSSPEILENLKETSRGRISRPAHKAKELQYFNTQSINLSIEYLEPFRVLDLINHDIHSLYNTIYNPQPLNVNNIPLFYEGFLISSFKSDMINVQELNNLHQLFYEKLSNQQGINNDLITHFKEYIKELHTAIVIYLQKEKKKVRNLTIYTERLTKHTSSMTIDFSDKIDSIEKIRYNKILKSYKKESNKHSQGKSLEFNNSTVVNSFNKLSIGPHVLIHIKHFKLHNTFEFSDCDIFISDDTISENSISLLKIVDLCYDSIPIPVRKKLYFMYYILFLFTHPQVFDTPDILQKERLLLPDEPVIVTASGSISIAVFKGILTPDPHLSSNIPLPQSIPSLPSTDSQPSFANANTLVNNAQPSSLSSNAHFKPTQAIIAEHLDNFIANNKTRTLSNVTPPSKEFITELILQASKQLIGQDTMQINNRTIQLNYLDENKSIPIQYCMLIYKFKIGNYLANNNQFQYIGNNIILNLVKKLYILSKENVSSSSLSSEHIHTNKPVLTQYIRKEFLSKYTATSQQDLALQLLDVIGEYVVNTINPALFTTHIPKAYGFSKANSVLLYLFYYLKQSHIIAKKSYYLASLNHWKTKISFYAIEGMFIKWDFLLEKAN